MRTGTLASVSPALPRLSLITPSRHTILIVAEVQR
jgi:hypothetical protein